MGKVLKIAVIVGLAVGIAVAAPWLAGFVAAAGTTAFTAASAAIAIGLSFAASSLVTALAGAPSATRGYHTAGITPTPEIIEVEPRSPGRWRDPIFLPGTRFTIEAMTGDCMAPFINQRWAIVDREATVRQGDFVLIRVGDQREYYARAFRSEPIKTLLSGRLFWALYRSPMGKRFIGVNGDRLLFDHTRPPSRLETDDRKVDVLYRVRVTAPTFLAAVRLLWRVRASPGAFDRRLAAANGGG